MSAQFEIIVLLEGIVESTGMTAQAKTSYLPSEVLWGHRFRKLVTYQRSNGSYQIDYDLFNSTYPVRSPACSPAEFYSSKPNVKKTWSFKLQTLLCSSSRITTVMTVKSTNSRTIALLTLLHCRLRRLTVIRRHQWTISNRRPTPHYSTQIAILSSTLRYVWKWQCFCYKIALSHKQIDSNQLCWRDRSKTQKMNGIPGACSIFIRSSFQAVTCEAGMLCPPTIVVQCPSTCASPNHMRRVRNQMDKSRTRYCVVWDQEKETKQYW